MADHTHPPEDTLAKKKAKQAKQADRIRERIENLPDRIIREPECEAMTGLERTIRHRMELRDEFPKRRRLSERSVGWLLSEVVDWMNSREQAA